MKHKKDVDRHHEILHHLHGLPRKMVSIHGRKNAPEFVLYELCHPHCFNIKKAAYFVDNPDFDYLKGVTGICHHESQLLENNIWQDPDAFTQKMNKSEFNNRVRCIERKSIHKNHIPLDTLVHEISKELHLDKPCCYQWEMKHDNHGILVFEEPENETDLHKEYLSNGVYFLSFCPIH